ncbi:MAG: hypothetical protein ACTSVC_12900 [Promethearchaeota archaeon]
MIEDEDKDVEELLKHKISWKSVLKTIVIFILMLISYFLIQFAGKSGGGSNWSILGFTLLCIASSLMVPEKKEEKLVRQTLSNLKCEQCGKVLIRDYKEGDYIFKRVGKCPECKGTMYVSEIYSVKITDDPKKAVKPNPKQQ